MIQDGFNIKCGLNPDWGPLYAPSAGYGGGDGAFGKNSDLWEEDMQAQGGVENQINKQQLRHIESIFRESDTDGGGGWVTWPYFSHSP